MLPNPIPYSESESLLLQRCFHFLVSFFLITFSSWSNYSLNCAKDCFTGLCFFPSFLATRKLDFSVPSFSKRRQLGVLCVVYAPPCFLPRLQCFLVRAFFGTLGLWSVPGCFVPFFSLCKAFSSKEALGSSDLSWPLLLAVRSFLVARSVGFVGSFLATYVLNCLERQKEQTHAHGSPTFLVKVELILPRVRARL